MTGGVGSPHTHTTTSQRQCHRGYLTNTTATATPLAPDVAATVPTNAEPGDGQWHLRTRQTSATTPASRDLQRQHRARQRQPNRRLQLMQARGGDQRGWRFLPLGSMRRELWTIVSGRTGVPIAALQSANPQAIHDNEWLLSPMRCSKSPCCRSPTGTGRPSSSTPCSRASRVSALAPASNQPHTVVGCRLAYTAVGGVNHGNGSMVPQQAWGRGWHAQ